MNTDVSNTLVVVPTYNGLHDLERLVDSLPHDEINLYVIDSSSTDGTDSYLFDTGIDHCIISQREFNHGATRQKAIHDRPGYRYYIFLTQDAYLAHPTAIARLLAPFADPKVGAVCGRQLPHQNANLLASHARYFNYPEISQIKSITDASQLGIKVAFLSNSFAAYRASALEEVGGFPSHVILAEDMYVAAKMLQQKWKIAYASDACCHHSHDYTTWQELSRYFDIGVFHAEEPWIRKDFGGAGGEGRRYVHSELRYLGWQRCYLWPVSLLANAGKLTGYKLGQQYKRLPKRMCQYLSMHKAYWR